MRELHNYWVALSLDEALRVKPLFKVVDLITQTTYGTCEKEKEVGIKGQRAEINTNQKLKVWSHEMWGLQDHILLGLLKLCHVICFSEVQRCLCVPPSQGQVHRHHAGLLLQEFWA